MIKKDTISDFKLSKINFIEEKLYNLIIIKWVDFTQKYGFGKI